MVPGDLNPMNVLKSQEKENKANYAQPQIVVNIFRVNLEILTSNFWFSLTCWFRKVREVCRKNFHLVAPLMTSVVTSYDQKTKIRELPRGPSEGASASQNPQRLLRSSGGF